MLRQPDAQFYTNTSPGKAVRVREASVFWIIRRGGAVVSRSVCRRSIFNLRVRSIWRNSNTSAPAAKVEAHPWKPALPVRPTRWRSEEHTSELQSRRDLVCRLLLEKK